MDLTQADDMDLIDSMGLFEAALVAKEPELGDVSIERVLVALDGSNQDATTAQLATELARRHRTPIVVVSPVGSEGAAGSAAAVDAHFQQAQADGVEIVHVGGPSVSPAPRPYRHLLDVARLHRCDWIVVDAPHQEDFAELGQHSVGTNLDMLMTHFTGHLLVVREPKDQPLECLRQIVLPITPYTHETVRAARWALKLAGQDGALRLCAIVDRETIESAGDLLRDFDEIDEQALAGLRKPAVAGLIAALQRQAAARAIGCRVSVRSGDIVPELAALANERDATVVLSSPRDAASSPFQRAQAIVRVSRNPVVVV